MNTVVAMDPDRVVVNHKGQTFWAQSLLAIWREQQGQLLQSQPLEYAELRNCIKKHLQQLQDDMTASNAQVC